MSLSYAARPDEADFRDLLYAPSLINVPAEMPLGTFKRRKIPVVNQGTEGACTGAALATMVHYLLRTRSGSTDTATVSMRMAYEMAKLNDRWPGEDYSGSSCRALVKGWHKHGICSEALWPYKSSDTGGALTPERAADAATRPLGAYMRVNSHNLTHMHAALTEARILLVSANTHKGWSQAKISGRIDQDGEIKGAHAFVIVGYDNKGFWIQNSWGEQWGDRGCAHLSYADWLANGMDVWACRLGVPVLLP